MSIETPWANDMVGGTKLNSVRLNSYTPIRGSFTNPNGNVIGSPGTLYLNTTGGADITLWTKETGVGTDTGWAHSGAGVAIVSADGSGTTWKLIVLADSSVRAVPISAAFPPAPTGLTATPHLTFIVLNWNPTAGAASYQLYRDGALLTTTTATTWNDAANITVGSTHNYYVIAVNSYGMWSPPSATATAFVDPALNSAPVFESITVWPANPAANDVVYVHINSHDMDAQQLTFALTTTVGMLTPVPNDPTTWTWTGS